MKTICIALCATIACLAVSCGSVDVQSRKIREIQQENQKLGNATPAVYVDDEEVEVNTNVIIMKDEVFVPIDSQTHKPMSASQVVQRSMQEAMVTPQNFIGGTQFYDYNEYKQYPVVCKMLSLTVIQLENGEVPIGVPYLSDTLRWELTGDVWRTVDGLSVQLVMLKPLEPGLTTNMILVTNQRIYQFVLTSTRDSYMPMVKFRYPLAQNRFITAETLRKETEHTSHDDKEGYFLSYNYKIVSGWFLSGWFKPEWQPTEAWDDGHKTYVRLPRGVLQREYPVIFEKANYIVNYRVNENIIIMDKLITNVTLKLDGKRVRIIKRKGEPEDLRRYVKKEAEVTGDMPPLKNGVRFEIKGDVPWVPQKVIEYDGETHIFFDEGLFNDGVLQIIDEKRNAVEYRRVGNVITIPAVIKKIQLAYNNKMLTITRK